MAKHNQKNGLSNFNRLITVTWVEMLVSMGLRNFKNEFMSGFVISGVILEDILEIEPQESSPVHGGNDEDYEWEFW